MKKEKIFFGMILLFGILLVSFSSAYMQSSPQYSQYGTSALFGTPSSLEFNSDMCTAGNDFLIQIAPFGCTPAVVRSDLLEEQNVPVYCQLGATQINPLIDVEAIESLSFSGNYPSAVSGVGFLPAKAALGTATRLNSPVLDNIGYAVIVLKKQENVSQIPKSVEGTLNVKIKYDIKSAFGIETTNFYLPVLSDTDWEENKEQYGFWNGRGYVRAEEVTADAARISLYDGTSKLKTIDLQKGSSSEKIGLPGFYCLANLNLKLNSLVNPDTKARLRVGDSVIEVVKGQKFLDDKCYVSEIETVGVRQKAKVVCREDTSPGSFGLGSKSFDLISSPKIKLSINNQQDIKEVEVGDLITDYMEGNEKRNVYLGYVYSTKGVNDLEIMLVSLPAVIYSGNTLNIGDLRAAEKIYQSRIVEKTGESSWTNAFKKGSQYAVGGTTQFIDSLRKGKDIQYLKYGQETPLPVFGTGSAGKYFYIVGFAEPVDESLDTAELQSVKNYYENAKKDYDSLINDFSSEKKDEKITYAEDALYKEILLANSVGQKTTAARLCSQFKEKYPKSSVPDKCSSLKLSDSGITTSIVLVNGRSTAISLEGIYEPTKKEYGADIVIKGPNGKTETISLQKGDKYSLDEFRGSMQDTFYFYESGSTVGRLTGTTNKPVLALRFNNGKWQINRADSNTWTDIETATVVADKYLQLTNDLRALQASSACQSQNKEDQENCFMDGRRLIWVSQGKTLEYIELTDLETDAARVKISVQKAGTAVAIRQAILPTTNTLKLNTPIALEGYYFSLVGVNLTKVAYVSVVPGIENAGSNTTFSFQIGIEKRSIELSPEKTEKIIENMNDSIKSWQDKSDKLGTAVKTLKGACLGVGAALTVKNFFANIGGRGIARQNVMRGKGGWAEICKQKVAAKEEGCESISKCYDKYSEQIEDWVDVEEKVIKAQNQQAEAYQDASKAVQPGGIFGDKIVNTDKYIGTASTEEIKYLKANKNLNGVDEIYYVDKDGNKQDMTPLLSANAYTQEGIYTTNDLRDIKRNAMIINDASAPKEMREAAQKNLNDIYGSIYNAHSSYISQKQAESTYGVDVDVFATAKLTEIKYSNDITYGSLKSKFSGADIKDTDKVRIVQDSAKGGNNYLVVLNDKGVVQKTYTIGSNNQLSEYYGPVSAAEKTLDKTNVNPLKLQFTKYDAAAYNNPYKGTPTLRYFETEPYKGLPAIVPVDVKKGWYASLKQTLPVFGGIKAYDASGRVTSFYLCNVGKNGLEEERGGDDLCTQINTGTGQPYNQIGGLSQTEANAVINKAVQAIEEASKKYKSGLKQTTILNQLVQVGAPAADIPDMQCEDLMSPDDCKLLFNVCDPVICPSSRCNLGGAYNVKDVVQSGIIGSLVLCLPNFPQVYVPICLTGVKAGIDGWISVMTSYRDCMQDSLDTGKLTGICDEIYSIHACEFFWRQGLPIAKFAIPKLIEVFSGQNAARGGGEYLGVQNAWSNAENSVNYFTQYYAANAFKAFQARSAEQVGSEVCNTFISGVYPSGDFLDTLTEPDSPAQFTGRFDEIPFTSATNPPISQYKVFYHIYSGTDAGGYYKVYLQGSASASYYQDTSSSRLVASGFVKKGEYASETLDFTAPSGYKELCINVNGQEKCGFKQTSTSFALDYVNDKYLQEQATDKVASETECVAGSPSVYSLASPSLEGAAQEMVNPAIYNRGIIRICATENPGKATDAKAGTNEARWRDVGYCGDTKIRCWLDTESVKNVVKNTNIENQIINDLSDYTEANLKVLISEGKYIENFDAKIKELEGKTDAEKITILNDIYNKVFYTSQKAKVLYLRGQAYDRLARAAWHDYKMKYDKQFREDAKTAILNEMRIALQQRFDSVIILDIKTLTITSRADIGGGQLRYTLSDRKTVTTMEQLSIGERNMDLEATSPVGMWELGREYYIIDYDNKIVATFALSPEEAEEILRGEDTETILKQVQTVLKQKFESENLYVGIKSATITSRADIGGGQLRYTLSDGQTITTLERIDMGNQNYIDLEATSPVGVWDFEEDYYVIDYEDNLVMFFVLSEETPIVQIDAYESYITNLAQTTSQQKQRTTAESQTIARFLTLEYEVSESVAMNIVSGNPDLNLAALKQEIESRNYNKKMTVSEIKQLAETTAQKKSRTEAEALTITNLLIREYSATTGNLFNIVYGNPDLNLDALRKEIESRGYAKLY